MPYVKTGYKRRRTMPARRRTKRRSYYKKRRGRRASFIGMQRREIGDPKAKSKCLSRTFQSAASISFGTKDLDSRSLTLIPHGSLADQRERNHVFVKGFRVDVTLLNRKVDTQIVHLCVLAPRDESSIDTANFFRAYTNEEGHQFGGLRNAVEQITSPINTDTYAVLAHKRIKVAGTVSNEGNDHKVYSFYTKLNRQITFESAVSGIDCKTPVYFVFWTDNFMVSSTSQGGTATVADSMFIQYRCVTFYTNMH